MDNNDFTLEKLMEAKKEILKPPSQAAMIKEIARKIVATKRLNEDLARMPEEVKKKAIDTLLAVQGMYDGWGIC